MMTNLSKFYYNEGLRLARDNQLSDAVRILAVSLGFNNENTDALKLAGLCYYRLGRLKMAEECFREFPDYLNEIKNDLILFNQYVNKGNNEPLDKKHIKQSIKSWSKKETLNVADLNYIGCLYMLCGKNDTATVYFLKALKYDKGNKLTTAMILESAKKPKSIIKRILDFFPLKGDKKNA